MYSICLRLFDFLHSLSFGFNRHTLAIFFGNAFPSFIVFLANLLSIKVIYFSKSLKYFQGSSRHTRRQRRLKNDLRAFLVILIESFSVITISWGIPIFLTMFHCQTLYVISISACPEIQKSLAIFLFTDLFNSSTNSLLYSLSGKLFRRKFLAMITTIFTCGRVNRCPSRLNRRRVPILGPTFESPSSTNVQNGIQSRRESSRRIDVLSTLPNRRLPLFMTQAKLSDDDRLINASRRDDESSLTISLTGESNREKNPGKRRSFKSFVLSQLRFITSKRTEDSRMREKILLNRLRHDNISQTRPDSSSSSMIPSQLNSPSKLEKNYSSTHVILTHDGSNSIMTKVMLVENITTL